MPFCVQFEKVGRGLLREVFWREGEGIISQKRGGNKKGSVLENAVNTEAIQVNTEKSKHTASNAAFILFIWIAYEFTAFSRTNPFLFPPLFQLAMHSFLSTKSFQQ